MKCHSSTSPAAQIDLSSYQALMKSGVVVAGKAAESSLFTSVANGSMPKRETPLSAEDVSLIREWITAGATELDLETAPTPSTLTPTYTWISKNILERKCIVCHNTAKPRAKVDLSSYEKLMASVGNNKRPIVPGNPEESTVFIEMHEQKMPPQGKKFSDVETDALRVWIVNGAKNDPATPFNNPQNPKDPGPPQPNYEWLSKNLFARRCGSCHGIPFKVGSIDFTSYQTLIDSPGEQGAPITAGVPAESGIYDLVSAGLMPPTRKELTETEIETVRQWIREGAKNN